MKATDSHHVRLHTDAATTLTENGWEEYSWRLLDDVPRLVAIRIGFTLRDDDHEEFDTFKQRMLRFATQLTEECGYTVTSLQLNRRAAQNKVPWAEFDCLTPEYRLPRDMGDGIWDMGEERGRRGD